MALHRDVGGGNRLCEACWIGGGGGWKRQHCPCRVSGLKLTNSNLGHSLFHAGYGMCFRCFMPYGWFW